LLRAMETALLVFDDHISNASRLVVAPYIRESKFGPYNSPKTYPEQKKDLEYLVSAFGVGVEERVSRDEVNDKVEKKVNWERFKMFLVDRVLQARGVQPFGQKLVVGVVSHGLFMSESEVGRWCGKDFFRASHQRPHNTQIVRLVYRWDARERTLVLDETRPCEEVSAGSSWADETKTPLCEWHIGEQCSAFRAGLDPKQIHSSIADDATRGTERDAANAKWRELCPQDHRKMV